MAVFLSPVGGAAVQFFDNSGNVLTGGKLYTYLAGTTTPTPTYTSNTGVTFHSNPIILDAAGRVPAGGEIWLADAIQYKFVLKDANEVLIGTYDNIIGINSNFLNYEVQQEIQTATAGQTVFNLSTIIYQPGTNTLSVFVDGVNQYGPGAQYAYIETDTDTVTFVNGLHVGALVKFTTAVTLSAGVTTAALVTYDPPFFDGVATTVENKLSEIVSVKDFGAVGDGATDDTVAFQNATNVGLPVYVPATADFYEITALTIQDQNLLFGPGVVKVNNEYTVINSAAPSKNYTDTDLAGVKIINGTQTPGSFTTDGAIYSNTHRTGGVNNYGDAMFLHSVEAELNTAEFDSVLTNMVTAQNLNGGGVFGQWTGANTPLYNATNAVTQIGIGNIPPAATQIYNSGFVTGLEINCGNRWQDFGLQFDISASKVTVGLGVFPAATGLAETWYYPVTVSLANPCVVSLATHGLVAGETVTFYVNGSATLPASIASGTPYYVLSSGLTTNSFQISATYNGTPISTNGESTSGQIKMQAWHPGSFGVVVGPSIYAEKWWVGQFFRDDGVMPNGYVQLIAGGTTANQAPLYGEKWRGYFNTGIDVSDCTFVGSAVKLGANQFLSIDSASITGATGEFSISTVGTNKPGTLWSNNYGQANIQWSWDGTNQRLGFFGAALTPKPTVTGSTDGNAALQSLVSALSTLGLITNSTT